jgi:hypothetical protein
MRGESMKQNKFNKPIEKQLEKERKVEISKEVQLEVHDVEEESLIVNVDGWRKRVYFDESLTKEQKEKIGRLINVKYFGDLEDVHSLKFLPLK